MSKINFKKIASFTLSLGILALFPLFVSFASNHSMVTPASPYTIDNPLGSNDLRILLGRIMDLVAKVGAIVVVFFIIFSGYKFVAARGNEGELSDAKDMFKWTVIGGAILLGADIIANVVVTTVKNTTGAN